MGLASRAIVILSAIPLCASVSCDAPSANETVGLATAEAKSAASAPKNAAYFTVAPIAPLFDAGTTLLLGDGNVNGTYSDPTQTEGYLDGPALAVFDWGNRTDAGCADGVAECANISSSEGFLTDGGVTRPHWGVTDRGRHAATLYAVLRDVSMNYFDVYTTTGQSLSDVDDRDEVVVMFDRPDTVDVAGVATKVCGGGGACMRPAEDTNLEYQIFRTARPDGRNGGAPYNERPRIFLGGAGNPSDWEVTVPVHEFGHYYNRVFVPKYGLGGGFDRHSGLHEEAALDEGLGYWYASDYAGKEVFGSGASTATIPTYSDLSDPSIDEHLLGNVVTSALWQVRQASGCDPANWRRTVFSVVDSVRGRDMGAEDPFGGGSIIRGFAARVLDAAESRGACTASALSAARTVFEEHELMPVARLTFAIRR